MNAPAGDGTVLLLAALAAGYLLGSIPFGLVLSRLTGHGDIRQIGSGNIGATNVLRTGSKGLAAATLLLDVSKGAIALLILTQFDFNAGLIAGLGAVFGHNFPVWLKFRGGKGVATTLGVLVAASWPVGLMACATWPIVAFLSRISSLSGLISLAMAPFYAYWLDGRGPVIGLAAVLALLAIIRHHANIGRLIRGEEPRIGRKKDAPEPPDESQADS
jgi:glycerol-3-phosphate acyltransferase PlsY